MGAPIEHDPDEGLVERVTWTLVSAWRTHRLQDGTLSIEPVELAGKDQGATVRLTQVAGTVFDVERVLD